MSREGAGPDPRRSIGARGIAALALIGIAATGGLVWAVASLVHAQGDQDLALPHASAPVAEPQTARDSANIESSAGIAALADPEWVADLAERTGIPPRALAAYAGADLHAREAFGCEVGWNSLAAIGLVETEHGTIRGGTIGEDGRAMPRIVGIPLDGTTTDALPDTDDGELDGDDRWDRAVGPLQFIPQTWEQWGADGSGDGAADIDQIDDAALTAARYLCEARGSMGDPESWIASVRSYNDSGEYQRRVAEAAERYAASVP